jgi:AcrR family transcriptional regulator
MPRPKTLSDAVVLDAAHRLIHEAGPDALTFARLAGVCGLSSSTLVQRFRSKAGLVEGTLLYAWDRLDAKTAALAAKVPKTPEGAIQLLVGLSKDYGDIERYADGLLVLREDLRNPTLRARGTAWKKALSGALEACFAQASHAPEGIGLMMASHWQGSLLWWSFDPHQDVEHYVQASLRRFVTALVRP